MDGKWCCPLTHAVREIVLIILCVCWTVFADVHPQSGLVHPPFRVHDSGYGEASGGQSRTADRRHSPPNGSVGFLLRGDAPRLSLPRSLSHSSAIQVFHAIAPQTGEEKGKSPFNPSKTEKPLPKTSHDLPVRKKTPQTSVFNAVMRFKTFDIAPAALLLLL